MARWQAQNDYRRGRNCVFLMHVHLVFVTKRRRKVFDADALNRLHSVFLAVCAGFEAELVQMHGEDDHVHLLVNYPPKVAIARLVNSLKGVSSRILRRDRPDMARLWALRSALWSPSYFCGSCGGAPLEVVKRYIEQQRTPA
jgi:putative transposase